MWFCRKTPDWARNRTTWRVRKIQTSLKTSQIFIFKHTCMLIRSCTLDVVNAFLFFHLKTADFEYFKDQKVKRRTYFWMIWKSKTCDDLQFKVLKVLRLLQEYIEAFSLVTHSSSTYDKKHWTVSTKFHKKPWALRTSPQKSRFRYRVKLVHGELLFTR